MRDDYLIELRHGRAQFRVLVGQAHTHSLAQFKTQLPIDKAGGKLMYAMRNASCLKLISDVDLRLMLSDIGDATTISLEFVKDDHCNSPVQFLFLCLVAILFFFAKMPESAESCAAFCLLLLLYSSWCILSKIWVDGTIHRNTDCIWVKYLLRRAYSSARSCIGWAYQSQIARVSLLVLLVITLGFQTTTLVAAAAVGYVCGRDGLSTKSSAKHFVAAIIPTILLSATSARQIVPDCQPTRCCPDMPSRQATVRGLVCAIVVFRLFVGALLVATFVLLGLVIDASAAGNRFSATTYHHSNLSAAASPVEAPHSHRCGVGTKVMARWAGNGKFYKAEIAALATNDRVARIEWADGDMRYSENVRLSNMWHGTSGDPCESIVQGGQHLEVKVGGLRRERSVKDGLDTCYEAHMPDFPLCSGYERCGYTCAGDWCAALYPSCEPGLCATSAGPAHTVDEHSGRCVLRGQQGQQRQQQSRAAMAPRQRWRKLQEWTAQKLSIRMPAPPTHCTQILRDILRMCDRLEDATSASCLTAVNFCGTLSIPVAEFVTEHPSETSTQPPTHHAVHHGIMGLSDSGGMAEDQLAQAHGKFKELDADDSGYLQGPEMKRLADWISEASGRGRATADKFHRREDRLGRTLMQRLDADGGGQLSFEEFAHWHSDFCAETIAAFKRTSSSADGTDAATEGKGGDLDEDQQQHRRRHMAAVPIDLDEIMAAVIAEYPPKTRGVRPEWEAMHRKQQQQHRSGSSSTSENDSDHQYPFWKDDKQGQEKASRGDKGCFGSDFLLASLLDVGAVTLMDLQLFDVRGKAGNWIVGAVKMFAELSKGDL